MSSAPVNAPGPARVVLLSGPSGSGKSTLAERSGLPVLRLDEFYRDGDDPANPQLPHDGGTDWDHPGSWHAEQALTALAELCAWGETAVPVYSIPANGRTGTTTLSLSGSPLFIAEGIFAAELARACADRGLLAAALCLRNHPATTAWRRLRRDVREARKPLPYLLHRGARLMRAEAGIVARQRDLGATPVTTPQALACLADLRSGEAAHAGPVTV